MTAAPATGVPGGFRPIAVGGSFLALNGPLYGAWRQGELLVGFRVEARHCNPAGQCHGGMLATLADMLLPYAAMYQLDVPRRFTPTIGLQVDFLAPALLGSWVEGRAEPLRSTPQHLFVQGVARVDGTPVLRASGLFKWGEPVPSDGDPRDPFGLRG